MTTYNKDGTVRHYRPMESVLLSEDLNPVRPTVEESLEEVPVQPTLTFCMDATDLAINLSYDSLVFLEHLAVVSSEDPDLVELLTHDIRAGGLSRQTLARFFDVVTVYFDR